MAKYIDADVLRKWIQAECDPYGSPTLDYETSTRIMDYIDGMYAIEDPSQDQDCAGPDEKQLDWLARCRAILDSLDSMDDESEENAEGVVDCHYCNYACTDSPTASRVDCYVEDGSYFDHHVRDAKEEAENCSWFRYCDLFPKY